MTPIEKITIKRKTFLTKQSYVFIFSLKYENKKVEMSHINYLKMTIRK